MRGRGEIGRRSGLKIRFSLESAGSSPAVRTSFRVRALAATALALASCDPAPREGPIQVSVIGDRFGLSDADRRILSPPDAVVAQLLRPGLVRFDASGQVVPALAESWITTGDGLSTIFRLRSVDWPGGATLTGEDVARRMGAAMSPGSRNALKPLLSSIDGVVGMTDRVVEVRLKVPRPNLLQLLAQPELGVARQGQGLGDWRIDRVSPTRLQLRSAQQSAAAGEAADPGVDLQAHRAARAIAGFAAGATDLVLGGTIADWPVVRLAQTRPGRLRFDPARGLMGIAVVGRNAFLSDAGNRQALAMAVDRAALAAMVELPGWQTREQLLPEQLDSARAPARPPWSTIAPDARRAEAARRIALWSRTNGAPPVLRIALPRGPGWRLVLARLTADWRGVGVTLVRAEPGTVADLRAIDAVAPNASANWFLSVTACEAGLVCDDGGDAALTASRRAATLPERAARIADADEASAARSSFIALGAPIRWLLVDPSLTLFRENAVAVHPLDQLRPAH